MSPVELARRAFQLSSFLAVALTTQNVAAGAPKPSNVGMVVLSVGFSNHQVLFLPRQSRNVSIIPVTQAPDGKEGDPIYAQYINGSETGTLTYLIMAPAGRYRLHRLFGAFRSNDFTHDGWTELDSLKTEFEVKAGAVVDAGFLAIRQQGQRRFTVRLPLAPRVLAHALAANPRDDAARFRDQPAVSAGGFEPGAPAALATIQVRADFHGQFFAAPDGQVLVPGKLGQLFRSEADHRWTAYSTGVAFDLLSVNLDRSGGLLVGAEFGTILRARDLYQRWQRIELPLGAGAVHGVVEAANGDLIAATDWDLGGIEKRNALGDYFAGQKGNLHRRPTLRIWRIARDGTATVLDEVSLGSNQASSAFAEGDDLLVASGAKQLGRWDGQASTWSWQKAPVDFAARQPDGLWTGFDGKRVPAFRPNLPLVSEDRGRTWTKLALGADVKRRVVLYTSVVRGDSPGEYAALARRPTLSHTGTDYGLQVTTDAGANWRKDSSEVVGCDAKHALFRGATRMWLVCHGYRVFGRAIGSDEWRIERELDSPD